MAARPIETGIAMLPLVSVLDVILTELDWKIDALTPITTALFNYIRPANASAYKADQIFPWIVEYEKNPDFEPSANDKVNESLLLFLTQAPGFSMEKVNGIQRTV